MMFIRSQDKTFIFKLQQIGYVYESGAHLLKHGGVAVGQYGSKEKALEQLDRITACLYGDKTMYELA